MALAGAPPRCGGTAVTNSIDPGGLLLVLIIFAWTPPHFWALAISFKDEYAKADIPMLPVVYGDRVTSQAIFWHTLALVVLSLSLFFYGMSWIYLLFALFGGGYFLYCSILLMKEQSKALARKTFFSSIIHLGLLLLGAMFDAMIFA